MGFSAPGDSGAEGHLLGVQMGVGWSEEAGKERHWMEWGGKKRWPGRRDVGLQGPQQHVRGTQLQQAGSCVPLIKYKGINELFVRAHWINISQAMDPGGGLLNSISEKSICVGSDT